jgi:hypothetical protein
MKQIPEAYSYENKEQESAACDYCFRHLQQPYKDLFMVAKFTVT